MKKLLIWPRVPFYNHCPFRFCYHRAKKYHAKLCCCCCCCCCCWSASRFRHYIFAKIWYARQRAVCIWKNYWTFFKLWVLAQDIALSFFLEVAFIDKTYLYPNALSTNISLNADVSENTLPFVSQSINNFSDYDVPQNHDWECPLCSLMFSLFLSIESLLSLFTISTEALLLYNMVWFQHFAFFSA